MDIEWDRNVESKLREMVQRTQRALAHVNEQYAGHPVDEVKVALASAWAASNDGAAITEPDLTEVASLISNGKRVWIEDDGRIMADD
jgi:hypothetical protein